MIRIAVLIALALPAFADEASKNAKIHELFQLTHVDQMQKQIMAQMHGMISKQMAGALPKNMSPELTREMTEDENHMFDVIMSRVSWTSLEPKITQIYAETFSEQEIDAIVAFYKSPAGQTFLDKMPVLMTKTMAVTQEQMQGLMPEIQRMSEEMAKKYAGKAQSGGGDSQP